MEKGREKERKSQRESQRESERPGEAKNWCGAQNLGSPWINQHKRATRSFRAETTIRVCTVSFASFLSLSSDEHLDLLSFLSLSPISLFPSSLTHSFSLRSWFLGCSIGLSSSAVPGAHVESYSHSLGLLHFISFFLLFLSLCHHLSFSFSPRFVGRRGRLFASAVGHTRTDARSLALQTLSLPCMMIVRDGGMEEERSC